FRNMMQIIQNLINETNLLSDAAINGNLSLRGNADKFEGGYKEVISGLNKTLDAVVNPIHEALEVLTEMSKDNLTVSMEGNYKGDYHKIKEAVNHLLDSFNSVLGDIHVSSRQVSQGSKQIAQSSQALSEGSTRQASSIEELSASIEEISSQTGRNAENANKANELAEKTKEKAVQGNSQMKEMLKAMDDINDASSNISKIIKVIDEIAFQTNILALNAAVEAARAGQHGKGFAVVAEEVRNLAARSADAAKETTSMIEGSIKKSEGGARIAKDTANALSAITEEVSNVASLVSDIALASSEQASGIAQINQGITQVSQVVQINSATSQESAAASEELSGQAEMLNEIVGRFKLKKSVPRNNDIHEEIYSLMDNINSQGEHHKVKSGADEHRQIILNENHFGKY
ncbi:MAG TPA: methyl-accepting chemotaxis protein, partial [Clostridia bacterium]